MDRHALVTALAALTDDEYADIATEARADDELPADPKARALAALRRHRGLDRTERATHEQAAAALAEFQRNGTD